MVSPNLEALASPIYNPTIDDQTKSLLNLMGEPSQDVIDYFTQIIKNLPTANPYVGVIENPRSCDIESAKAGLDNLQSELANSLDPTIIAALPSISANLDIASSTLSDYENHTDSLIANLPNILGIIQTALGLMAALAGLLNPCTNLSGFLNSILAAGAALMASIISAIGAVIGVIALGLSAVLAAMAVLMSLIAKLAALIASEISMLVNALIKASQHGLAQLMQSLGSDPCLNVILASVGTAAAVAVLRK